VDKKQRKLVKSVLSVFQPTAKAKKRHKLCITPNIFNQTTIFIFPITVKSITFDFNLLESKYSVNDRQ